MSRRPSGTSEFLNLDMSRDTRGLRPRLLGGAIDYARIKLSATATARRILLSKQMAAIEQADHGDYPAPVLTEASDDQFSISSNEAAFRESCRRASSTS